MDSDIEEFKTKRTGTRVLASLFFAADNGREVMNMNKTKTILMVMLVVGARVLPSQSCATVSPEEFVNVTDESAIIVWDAARKREHFIRGATFDSAARDIGFLVPTPSVPELKAADRGAFAILQKVLLPKVEYRSRNHFEFGLLLAGRRIRNTFNAAGNAMSEEGHVDILQTQTVAGYDATTLKANDTAALNRWLNQNGYLVKADLRDWLAPYIAKGWVITAFKIRKADKNSRSFSSQLVRMSFDTDKPFYPYREPASQRQGAARKKPRSLRVFFIGDQRVAGVLGTQQKRAWPGVLRWSDDLANHLDESQRVTLAKNLAMKPEQFPAKLRMTSFEDFSSPRPGVEDVYFKASSAQGTMLPPPIIRWTVRWITIPLDVIFVVGGVLLFATYAWLLRARNS
jgi:hypothetical protein